MSTGRSIKNLVKWLIRRRNSRPAPPTTTTTTTTATQPQRQHKHTRLHSGTKKSNTPIELAAATPPNFSNTMNTQQARRQGRHINQENTVHRGAGFKTCIKHRTCTSFTSKSSAQGANMLQGSACLCLTLKQKLQSPGPQIPKAHTLNLSALKLP